MADTNGPVRSEPDLIELNGTKKLLYPDGRVYRVTNSPEYVDLGSKYDRIDAAQDEYRREMVRKCGADLPDLPKRVHSDNQPEIVHAATGIRYYRSKFGYVVKER